MRKKVEATPENRRSLKQRLKVSLAMLLIALILVSTAAYAWLVLSVSPEVKGIATTIGANGSLEIALLSGETYTDPNSIRTPEVGESLSNNQLTSNETWGNLVDLNDSSYGLQEIVLYPSRLNITVSDGNYKVNRNGSMLLVPTYGADGRIMHLDDTTLSGTYNNNEFSGYSESLDYGVRAIGTANAYNVQSSALSQAKSTISLSISGAINSAKSSVDGIQDMLIKFAAGGDSFTAEDIDTLKGMINRLSSAEEHIEDALRQGLVAIAASAVADETEFKAIRSLLTSDTHISVLLNNAFAGYNVPAEFSSWVEKQEEMENNISAALAMCDALDPATATKEDVKPILDYLMDLDQVLVGDKLFKDMSASELINMAGALELTLKPGSGMYADVADFAGNYRTSVGSMAELKTVSAVNPSYLNALLIAVNDLTPANGGSTAAEVKLEDTYGYALDLAFRCNANTSDLLLQTDGIQRVYDESDSDATMGSGSYMEFATVADVDFEKLTRLMDAVRVAFVDDSDNLLGIAKLNISNRAIDSTNGNVKAPLYLYDYEIGTTGNDNGRLIMGERRDKSENAITTLERNIAKAVSVLVWLDGDCVDNTMVSAETNVSGIMNIQFASSADLVPANSNGLYNYIADRDGLNKAVSDAYNNYLVNGQGDYTTLSWNNFTNAYNRAKAISENQLSSENLMFNTIRMLSTAIAELETLDRSLLSEAIDDMREEMGETDEDARLIQGYDDNGNPILLKEYTQEQFNNSTKTFIKSVDYNKNLKDEGNDLMAPIYTDESWYSMADTLYFAEALAAKTDVTLSEIDMAVTQMQLAEDALEYAVYYTAYDLYGTIYYKAIPENPEDNDTYGTWYDYNLKRVLSELIILELDAYAKKTEVADMQLDEWVTNNEDYISPYADLLVNNQEIRGIYWKVPSEFSLAITAAQIDNMRAWVNSAETLSISDQSLERAKEILGYGTTEVVDNKVTYDEAAQIIKKLSDLCKEKQDSANSELPDTSITANQRVVLNKAILNANSIIAEIDAMEEGDEKTEALIIKNALATLITEAQALLVKENPVATCDEAEDMLDSLNAKIEEYDSSLVATEDNTITISVPAEFSAYDVVYNLDADAPVLLNDAPVGTYTFSAKIITNGGILTEVEKTMTIYNKAIGIGYSNDSGAPVVEEEKTISAGESYTLEYILGFIDGLDDEGHELETTETIGETTDSEIEYSSSNASVLKYNGDSTFEAVSAGTANILVRVVTDQGNVYSTTYPVTITVS